MRRFLGTGALFTALACSTGCATRVTDFTAISTKNLTISGERGSRVTGKDCTWYALSIPLGAPNLKEAIDRAIEAGGPGVNALEDGVVYYKGWTAVLTGQMCYVVEGTAVKVKDGARSDNLWAHSDVTVADVD
jgi:carbohydrate-binding DOMON domain-containing protein